MDLNSQNFNQAISSEKPIIVDFWAPWCGPCKLISPTVDEIGQEYADRVSVAKVNVDENNDIAMRYGVMSIPTLKFFKGGQVIGEIVGAAPKQMIVAQLENILANASKQTSAFHQSYIAARHKQKCRLNNQDNRPDFFAVVEHRTADNIVADNFAVDSTAVYSIAADTAADTDIEQSNAAVLDNSMGMIAQPGWFAHADQLKYSQDPRKHNDPPSNPSSCHFAELCCKLGLNCPNSYLHSELDCQKISYLRIAPDRLGYSQDLLQPQPFAKAVGKYHVQQLDFG